MTASSISVPTTTTAELATDEIDDRHFQGVKIFGGGEGAARELFVGEDGAAKVAGTVDTLTPWRSFFGGKPITETSYADKELIGGWLSFGSFSPGSYELGGLALIFADFDTPAFPPAPFPPVRLAILGVPTGTDVSAFDVDGFDATTTPIEVRPGINWLPTTVHAEEDPLGPGIRRYYVDRMPIVFSNDASPGDDVDVYGLVMSDGAIADDLTAFPVAIGGFVFQRGA